jgi:hypothetical protein
MLSSLVYLVTYMFSTARQAISPTEGVYQVAERADTGGYVIVIHSTLLTWFAVSLDFTTMSAIITILIRTTLFLGKPLLLIGGLALLTPFWGLIFACILLFITLFLSLVHCPGIVLGGTVHSNQFQRLILAGVVELVFCARWYDDYIAGFDVLFFCLC